MRKRQYFLLHVLRERVEFPDLLHRAAAIAQRFSAHRILVEDASSGSALAQALRALVTCPVIAIKPKLDKPARVQRASAVFDTSDFSRLRAIREQFGPFFNRATEGRMTVRTTLAP